MTQPWNANMYDREVFCLLSNANTQKIQDKISSNSVPQIPKVVLKKVLVSTIEPKKHSRLTRKEDMDAISFVLRRQRKLGKLKNCYRFKGG